MDDDYIKSLKDHRKYLEHEINFLEDDIKSIQIHVRHHEQEEELLRKRLRNTCLELSKLNDRINIES